MKVNLKDNKKWAAEERRRLKKRGIILASVILLSAAAFTGTVRYRCWYLENGRYYPQITLEDTPAAGEPVVYAYEGFDNVVRSPSLPFTMLTAGDVLSDHEEYCIFLYQDAYYVIAETEEESTCILKDLILPVLGADVTGSTCFNVQEGYLNNRHVETQCLTFALGDRGNLYSVNYRLLLSAGRDIVIAGISADMDVDGVCRNVEKIFYSIREIVPQKEGKTTVIDFEAVGGGPADSMIGNITVHVDGNGEYPMDQDFLPEGTLQSEIQSNPGGIHKLEPGTLYKSNEEKAVTVEEDFDTLAFVFSYGLPVELTDIELVSPSGDIYDPDERHKFLGYDYVFLVDRPMQGEWRFVWTAPDRIGNYEVYYTKPMHYNTPAELAQRAGNKETP